MFSWFKQRFFPFRRRNPRCFLPADQFRAHLDCERMRSDRNGGTFSFVIVTFPNRDALERDAQRFAEILEERLRATDEAGEWDEQRLGIVLPDTSEQGACNLADKICELFAVRLTYKVYVYPDCKAESGAASANNGAHADPAQPKQSIEVVQAMQTLFARPMPRWKRLVDVVGSIVGLLLIHRCWRLPRLRSS
jgi:GGDEF domain-containing protein